MTLTKAQQGMINRLQEDGVMACLCKYRGYSCFVKMDSNDRPKRQGWANPLTMESLIKRGLLVHVYEAGDNTFYRRSE